MDSLDHYRQVIENILREHAAIPYSYGDIQRYVVVDREGDHYLLMAVGWERNRVHHPVIHVDIINGKFWVQYDGTEYGVARELADAGVPKDHIVLGFREPEIRPYTEYAVA